MSLTGYLQTLPATLVHLGPLPGGALTSRPVPWALSHPALRSGLPGALVSPVGRGRGGSVAPSTPLSLSWLLSICLPPLGSLLPLDFFLFLYTCGMLSLNFGERQSGPHIESFHVVFLTSAVSQMHNHTMPYLFCSDKPVTARRQPSDGRGLHRDANCFGCPPKVVRCIYI